MDAVSIAPLNAHSAETSPTPSAEADRVPSNTVARSKFSATADRIVFVVFDVPPVVSPSQPHESSCTPNAPATPNENTNAHPTSVAVRNIFATPPPCDALRQFSAAATATARHANPLILKSALCSNPPASQPGITLAT